VTAASVAAAAMAVEKLTEIGVSTGMPLSRPQAESSVSPARPVVIVH